MLYNLGIEPEPEPFADSHVAATASSGHVECESRRAHARVRVKADSLYGRINQGMGRPVPTERIEGLAIRGCY